MSKRKSGRKVSAALCACVLLFSVAERVGPTPAMAEADNAHAPAMNADDLARATADRFARAIDHADVTAATRECSLPHLNLFGDIASDAAALQQSLEWFTDFARRHPEAGVYYRGITACVHVDDFRRGLGNAPQDPKADRKRLANLDRLKLGTADRVVFVRWMYAYSVLVRVRDGNATVAGLGPLLPQEAMKNLAAAAKPYRQVRDVVYGRTYGAALTLDVLTPIHGANGAAVICVQSGDFVSQPLAESDNYVLEPLLLHGYTVITVVHGGLPKYTVAETIRHVERAVRFIRFHARDYAIDPNRIGATGSSSGGYLSLMLATAGAREPPLADESDPVGKPDEIDAVSCRVQAAGCYFPPTDWLDYGAENRCVLDANFGPQLKTMLQFYEFDNGRFAFTPISDRARTEHLLADISPARRVTKETAPIFLLHGEKDPTVPLQQSQVMIERLKAAGVPAKLVVKPGAGHGWNHEDKDLEQIRQWFDTYLATRP